MTRSAAGNPCTSDLWISVYFAAPPPEAVEGRIGLFRQNEANVE
jgi:hypothetical protein